MDRNLGSGPQAGVSVATQEGPGAQLLNAAVAFHMAEQKHSALKEQTLAPGRGAQHWLRYGCRNTLLALSTAVPALGEHKACTQHHKALRPGDQGFLKVIKTRHIQWGFQPAVTQTCTLSLLQRKGHEACVNLS